MPIVLPLHVSQSTAYCPLSTAQMAAEEAALREEEARADAAGRQRATRFRLQLVTGDLGKAVTGGWVVVVYERVGWMGYLRKEHVQ